MGRIVFPKGQQSRWLNQILRGTKLSIKEIAEICGVCTRTFKDWKKEKFTISETALLQIHRKLHIPLPTKIKKISDFWYVAKGARSGGLRRLELYGPPGTAEGRKKGGKISQQRRRENPEKYRLMGCNVRKDFPLLRLSKELAETVGIILGDGGVTDCQLRITLNKETDKEYAYFVKKLFSNVFKEIPSFCERKNQKVIDLIISGINLIENLGKIGIGKGDKIRRQVDIPEWIWEKLDYQVACIRGLVDTDGGVYFHKHWTKGIQYRNLGLCFTSWSRPLIRSVSIIFKKFNIKHSIDKEKRIYVYSLDEVIKYFCVFGSNNPKHKRRLEFHKTHSRVLGKFNGGVA